MTEARSEHPPADVEESARRIVKTVEDWEYGRISDATCFRIREYNALIVARAYLSERTRREKIRAEAFEEAAQIAETCMIYGEHWRRDTAKAIRARASLESPQTTRRTIARPQVPAPLPSTAEIPAYMGTQEDALRDLLNKIRIWRGLRQPYMAPAREQRKREAAEHEARFQLANAAVLWLWHMEQSP